MSLLYISPIFANQASQAMLNKAVDLSYTVRGAYRVQSSIPDDKKPSYLLRDYALATMNPFFFELGRRLVNEYYTGPKITEILELNQLAEKYGEKFPHAQNYSSLFELPELQNMLVGNLTKVQSLYTIPRLYNRVKNKDDVLAYHLQKRLHFKDYLNNKVAAGKVPSYLAEAVIDHGVDLLKADKLDLQKHFEGSLERTLYQYQYKPTPLNAEQTKRVTQAIETFYDGTSFAKKSAHPLLEDMNTLLVRGWRVFYNASALKFDKIPEILGIETQKNQAQKKQVQKKTEILLKSEHLNDATRQIIQTAKEDMLAMAQTPEKVLARMSTLQFDLAHHQALDWLKQQGRKLSEADHGQLKKLIGQAMKARVACRKIELVKSSFVLPDLLATTAALLFMVGIVGTALDNLWAIPWQRQYAAKGGNPAIVQKPALLSVFPALGLFGLMMHRKSPVNKLGYFGKVAFATPVMFATYAAIALTWINHRLNNTPLPKPVSRHPARPNAPASPNPAINPFTTPASASFTRTGAFPQTPIPFSPPLPYAQMASASFQNLR